MPRTAEFSVFSVLHFSTSQFLNFHVFSGLVLLLLPLQTMRAYSADLAWRVVFRVLFCGQDFAEVQDAETGLGVSWAYIDQVIKRYLWSGGVATRQGVLPDNKNRRRMDFADDLQLMTICSWSTLLKSP